MLDEMVDRFNKVFSEKFLKEFLKKYFSEKSYWTKACNINAHDIAYSRKCWKHPILF